MNHFLCCFVLLAFLSPFDARAPYIDRVKAIAIKKDFLRMSAVAALRQTGPKVYNNAEEVAPSYFQESLVNMLKANSSTILISTEEFENMLDTLEIGRIHEHEHEPHPAHTDDDDHDEARLMAVEDDPGAAYVKVDEHCYSMEELLKIYGIKTNPDEDVTLLSYDNLASMFPAVIQQQLTKACIKLPNITSKEKERTTIAERYGYGTAAVAAISVCPFIFIFIIPSTKHQSYVYVMNALIALSASTLVGDALLHLLPQALKLHGHAHEGEESGHQEDEPLEVPDFVQKMVVVCAALYAFYLFEMIVNGPHHAVEVEEAEHEHGHGHSHMPPPNYGATKKKPKEEKKEDKNSNNAATAKTDDDKLETSFTTSAPAVLQVPEPTMRMSESSDFLDELPHLSAIRSRAGTLTFDIDHQIFRERLPTGSSLHKHRFEHDHHVRDRLPTGSSLHKHHFEHDHFRDRIATGRSLQNHRFEHDQVNNWQHSSGHSHHHYHHHLAPPAPVIVVEPPTDKPVEGINPPSVTVPTIVVENKTPDENCHHEKTDDCHDENECKGEESCFKSFLHELIPEKTLGWMVICGDAIHNIIDGIAIGAAFSGSLVSGLSTSIAIVCHEIPHEVGDFAALLASGVSWRGGIVWNLIFSVLALGGLYIGISVGDDDSARLWVFALTSGMFLYVALTEMMPELTRVRGKFWYYFGFQNLGLLLGFGLMLIIAIFEEKMAEAMAGSLGGGK